MKTTELIKYFKDEGYTLYQDAISITFDDVNGDEIIEIDKYNSIGTIFDHLPFDKQQEYYKVIFEYLMTPPEEREEEEKRYYLRQKGMGSWSFLNFNINSQEYSVANKQDDYTYKTQFTQSEIDNMPECYTHPAVWEQIEVEDN